MTQEQENAKTVRSKSRALPMIVGLASGALLLAAGGYGWHWYSWPTRLQAELPAAPNLGNKPPILSEKICRARELARSRATALEGVAALGRLYHANGFLREAETCWRILRSAQPHEARWCYYLADLARSSGDYADMPALLAKTTALAPDYAPAWLKLADFEFKNGQLDQAQSHYQRRLELLPHDPYATLGLARIAMQQGRKDEARRLIEQIVRDTPDFPPAHNFYAEMVTKDGDAVAARWQRWLGRETGRFREADDPWLSELNTACYDPKRIAVLATIEFQLNRGDRGRALMERAAQLAPDDPSSYESLADLDLKLNDPAAAREVLERGLKRATRAQPSEMYFFLLSESCRLLKHPSEAAAIAERALIQNPNSVELHNARGMALGDLGRPEEAMAEFRLALDVSPNDVNSNFNLAMVLQKLGRPDEAITHLKRTLVLNPHNRSALEILSRHEMDAGRLDSARTYLFPLYDSFPGLKDVRELMAEWDLRTGAAAAARNDTAAAEQAYRDGIVADPENPELNANLGVMYLVQGKVADAISPLETFHRLKPHDPQGCFFLGQAYARAGRLDEAKKILSSGERLAEQAGNRETAGHLKEILEQLGGQ